MVAAEPAEVESNFARLAAEPLLVRSVTVCVVPAVSFNPFVRPPLLIAMMLNVLEPPTVMLSPVKVIWLYVFAPPVNVLPVAEVSLMTMVDVSPFMVPPVQFHTVPVPVRVIVPEPIFSVGVDAPALMLNDAAVSPPEPIVTIML